MRPHVVFVVVTLAVLGVLAALPLGEAAGSSSWPCCDDCGRCNRKFPPECRCKDISVNGCHPECKKCVRSTVTDGAFECADMITNFCKRSCTAKAPAAAFLGEAF